MRSLAIALALAVTSEIGAADPVNAHVPWAIQSDPLGAQQWSIEYFDVCGKPIGAVRLPLVQVAGRYCLLRRDGVHRCQSVTAGDFDVNVRPIEPPPTKKTFPMSAIACPHSAATHGLLVLIHQGSTCSEPSFRHQIDILQAAARDARYAIAMYLRQGIDNTHSSGIRKCNG